MFRWLTFGKQIHSFDLPNFFAAYGFAALHARQSIDEIRRPNRDKNENTDVLLWNNMIREHAGNGQFHEAIKLYHKMRSQTIPNKQSFVFVVKACGEKGTAMEEGKQIHSHILKCGFHSNVIVGTCLMEMYAKCGLIEIARKLFDEIPQKKRDAIAWNAMIKSYLQCGNVDEVLRLVGYMRKSQVRQTCVTIITLVSAFIRIGFVKQGKIIHGYVIRNGFHTEVSVMNALMGMYAKLGCIEIACRVFDKMSQRDVVSWSSMICGCARNGQPEEALALLHHMERTQVKPNHVTILSVLSACADLGALQKGKDIHSYMTRNGFELDDSVGSALVAMYAKCGSVDLACKVFDKLSKRDAVLWNAMIGGYTQNAYDDEALALFHEMQVADVEPDKVTMVSILPACAHLKALPQGMCIHSHSLSRGLLSHTSVCNALIDMYAKCGSTECARLLFDKMPRRDLVSWNTVISGYAQNGDPDMALALFHKFPLESMTPNLITIVSILRVCGDLKALQEGKDVHDYSTKSGFDLDVYVMTALVAMYAKCGDMEAACQLFDKMPQRDIISWNAMIAGYIQNGHASEALTLFHQLQLADVKPDSATMVTLLSACAHLGTLQHGVRTHAYIIRSGFEMDVSVGTSLIDMYAKCGNVDCSYELFRITCNGDVATWNAMIAAYGMNGHGENALALFSLMREAGPKPDHITFICVLSACSHSGLVDEGWQYFDCMSRDYCITPRMEHYACMVDLLGRVGLLNEAHKFILNMPLEPGVNVWSALLFACKIHCNIELGVHVAKLLLELDSKNSGAYILLSSIYSTTKRWNNAAKIRTMIKEMGLEKSPGCSWIEIKNRVHLFFAGDKSHKQSEALYTMLDSLG